MWSRLQKNPITIGFENNDSTLLSTQHYITNVKLHITDNLAEESLVLGPEVGKGKGAFASAGVSYLKCGFDVLQHDLQSGCRVVVDLTLFGSQFVEHFGVFDGEA